MALGQAAGLAASLSIEDGIAVRKVDIEKLQRELLKQKAVLIYYDDVSPAHPLFQPVQYFGLRGLLPGWSARLDEAVSAEDAAKWIAAVSGHWPPQYREGTTRRGELLQALYEVSIVKEASRTNLASVPTLPEVKISTPRVDAANVAHYTMESPNQSASTTLRVIELATAVNTQEQRILFVLPVEPNEDNGSGDGLTEIIQQNLHLKYAFIVAAPSFEFWPW